MPKSACSVQNFVKFVKHFEKFPKNSKKISKDFTKIQARKLNLRHFQNISLSGKWPKRGSANNYARIWESPSPIKAARTPKVKYMPPNILFFKRTYTVF